MYLSGYIGHDGGTVLADLAAAVSIKNGEEAGAISEIVIDDNFFYMAGMVQSSIFWREG